MDAQTCRTAELGITRSRTFSGFRIKEFTQPPHRRLPWHEHHDASICFVVAGTYKERMRGFEKECEPHSMVFKPAAERHADQFGRLGATCLLIEIAPDRLQALEPFATVTGRPGVARSTTLARLGQRMFREFCGMDAWSPLALEGLILETLAEASRAGAETSRAHRPPIWLGRVRELIHDGGRESVTLSAIAREIGIHPAHLARTFRRHYHCTIGEYVRRIRLEQAASELTASSDSLAAISLRLGFFDQSHFSRSFKLHTGLTPAEFRGRTRARNAGTNTHGMS